MAIDDCKQRAPQALLIRTQLTTMCAAMRLMQFEQDAKGAVLRLRQRVLADYCPSGVRTPNQLSRT